MARKKKKRFDTPDGVTVLVRNKRAFYDYQISERVEAGLVLLGSEVKSLRDGRGIIADGYVEFRHREAWLVGMQIKEYPWANQFNHDPHRDRKLLLHRREIKKLAIRVQQRGFTLVPLSVYLRDGKIKVEIGLGSGKRQYEKRQAEKEATAKREIREARRGSRS